MTELNCTRRDSNSTITLPGVALVSDCYHPSGVKLQSILRQSSQYRGLINSADFHHGRKIRRAPGPIAIDLSGHTLARQLAHLRPLVHRQDRRASALSLGSRRSGRSRGEEWVQASLISLPERSQRRNADGHGSCHDFDTDKTRRLIFGLVVLYGGYGVVSLRR